MLLQFVFSDARNELNFPSRLRFGSFIEWVKRASREDFINGTATPLSFERRNCNIVRFGR